MRVTEAMFGGGGWGGAGGGVKADGDNDHQCVSPFKLTVVHFL